MMNIQLGKKKLENSNDTYFIAEMSGNHNQSLAKALEIVDAAAASGADALKIQTYTPDTMTLNIDRGEFVITDKNSLWKNRKLYDLYQEAMTPWEWHADIKKRCEQHNIDFFSTPFDSTAINFLESLGVPFYKIASFENTDLPLIEEVAKKQRPVIISTGMASLIEIAEAVETIKKTGNHQIILLKCTSAYPARFAEANLITIKTYKEIFQTVVGLSDHTMGITAPIVAATYGARVFEKHFTLDRREGGVDSEFSMEPDEFKEMVSAVSNAILASGENFFGASPRESKSLQFRRSLYISKDMKKGDILTPENLRAIRPGSGLPPKYISLLLGKKVNTDLEIGTPMKMDFI